MDITTSVKVADALVDNLGLLFDGVGYNEQGYFAQLFLTNIARRGEITPVSLIVYLEKLNEISADIVWLTDSAKNQAMTFVSIVDAFSKTPSSELADKIIAYTM